MNIKRLVLIVLGGAIALFLVIQLLPFGHTRTNPPVVSEPNWSSPEARALVKEHCFQCHSNETDWPWYSNIAPGSWLIAMDVNEGRSEFNFSDWQNHPGELDEMVEKIENGEMPPIQYWLAHPNSKMNDQQKQELIDALSSSLK
ncbi:MAG TPA: heme-binding domain-containing protein [Candidatus Paceibacterota bacterium]|nr:heme-binding domain-containing protein [Candidatus Paceibacterota bacterium]